MGLILQGLRGRGGGSFYYWTALGSELGVSVGWEGVGAAKQLVGAEQRSEAGLGHRPGAEALYTSSRVLNSMRQQAANVEGTKGK